MVFGMRNTFWPAAKPRPRVDPAMRIYAVGDVHGRFDLLGDMLRTILRDYESGRDGRRLGIVFLGDYIDRGDQSREVLDTLGKLIGENQGDLVALRGNHEDALLGFLRSPLSARSWLDYGARQTLASFGVKVPRGALTDVDLVAIRDAAEAAMAPHLEFLRRLPTFTTSGDVLFTHAGVAQGGLGPAPDDAVLLWGRDVHQGDWPAPGKLVVHGHFDAIDPVDRPGRICVDTGAYYSGRLTAVRLDEGVGFLSVGR